MITELQARRMTNEQVLGVLQKACNRYEQKLIHAQYNPTTLELTALVDEIKSYGSVEADVDSVLIGLWDLNFKPVADNTLCLVNEPCCPSTIITCNADNYHSIARATRGVQLV